MALGLGLSACGGAEPSDEGQDSDDVADVGEVADLGDLGDLGEVLDTEADTGTDTLVTTTFAAANAEIPNPDRGFYAFIDDLTVVSADDLQAEFDAGIRLVYTPIRLDDYRDREIPDTDLALLNAGLDRVQAAGLGLILRFTYNYPETEADYLGAKDAPLDRVRAHLFELAPLITTHAELITYWQAGFIGAWGEWHTSSNNLTTPASKAAVRDALLEVLPARSFLQLRYPPDLVVAHDTLSTPRIGFHNDCFMASDTDVGTFEEGLTDPLREAMAILSETTPMGGETCNADEPTAQRRSCQSILNEGRRYHVSYLNRDYHTAFHDTWRREGCFAEVERTLGYRLEPRHLTHPPEVSETLPLMLAIANTGWSRPYANRTLSVVLSGDAGTFTLGSGVDIRSLTPGDHTLDLEFALTSVPAGDYTVALALFAADGDPRRAVRFAVQDDRTRGQMTRDDGSLTTGTTLRVLAPAAR